MTAPSIDELRKQFADIPEAMREAPRWLVWISEANDEPGKKPRKVPCYTNGRGRGKTDTEEDCAAMASFEEAIEALASDKYAGLGFALGPDGTGNHWQGIDLDDIPGRAGLELVADDLPGYTEDSPSGKGRHAIGYGREFGTLGSNSTGIEAYSRGRFFTVTGARAGRGEIVCLADFVEGVLGQLHVPNHSVGQVSATTLPIGARTIVVVDKEVEADLRSALNRIRSDDRGLWVRMGHALWELGDAGRGLWLDWSQMSEKYELTDAARTWDSFRPTHTGYQAVFAEAQRQGWVNPRSRHAGPSGPRSADALGACGLGRAANASASAAPCVAPVPLSECLVDVREYVDPGSTHPCVIESIIPQGEVTLLAGHGGSGKSYISLKMAVHIAMGLPFGPLATIRTRVGFFSAEDDKPELLRRVARLCRSLGVEPASLHDWLFLLDVSERDPTLYSGNQHGGCETPSLDELAAFMKEYAIGLMVIDNASDTFAGQEISRVQVRAFVRGLRTKLGRPASAVLLLAHISKAAVRSRNQGESVSDDYSGSTAWHNSVRSRLSLTLDGGQCVVRHEKHNKSAGAEPLRLDWHDGVPVLADEDLPMARAVRTMMAAADEKRDDAGRKWLLDVVRDFEQREEYLSTSTTGGHTLYHAVRGDKSMPKGLGPDRVNEIARSLERDGQIARKGILGKNRKPRSVFVLAPDRIESAPMPDVWTFPTTSPEVRIEH